MAVCNWKKVKFKSFSQSEWQCLTCGETGYASHEKPPVNCVKIKFGKLYKTEQGRFTKISLKNFFYKNAGLAFISVGTLLFLSGYFDLVDKFVSHIGVTISVIGLIYLFYPKSKNRNLFSIQHGEKLPWYRIILYIISGAMPYWLIFLLILFFAFLAAFTS